MEIQKVIQTILTHLKQISKVIVQFKLIKLKLMYLERKYYKL